MRRWLNVLTAGMLGASTLLGADRTGEALRAGWEYAATTLIREASQHFGELVDASHLPHAARREATLGRAVVELQMQPFSNARITAARGWLEQLLAEDTEDEVAIRARYLLGRMRQLHPNGMGAGEVSPPEFLVLLRDHPQHYLAQLAQVKRVLHRLYEWSPQEPAARRLEDAERWGANLHDPRLRSDFHLAMGEAYLFHADQQEPALRHFLAAERLGIPDSNARGTVLVQIGELSRLAGQREEAVRAYRSFLRDFRRDPRMLKIQDRLEELEGAE
jgi:tetratricopeptide (TPR) repeat protein